MTDQNTVKPLRLGLFENAQANDSGTATWRHPDNGRYLFDRLDYWRDVHGGSRWPQDITYRAMAPVYAGEKYLLRTEETGREDRWKIVVDKGGVVCMQGEITG